MKIWGMSDIHLGVSNDKMENLFEANFENCIKNISENGEDNIILIAGDLFDKPIVKNEISNTFLKIVNKYKNNIKFMISAGNHDSSPIKKSTLDIFENFISISTLPICNTENIKGYVFEKFSDIPPIIVGVDTFTRVILEEFKIIIDLLPYFKNTTRFKLNKEEKSILSRGNDYYNFLSCHGIAHKNEIYSDQDVIDSSYLAKRDFIIKGHIHQIYNEEVKRSPIFSTGSLNNNSSKSEGCYIEIYDSNEPNSDESIEINNDQSIKKLGNIVNRIFETDNKYKINYKIFSNEDESTINDTLKTLGEKDIVSILYSGDHTKINEEEYMRCYKECIKFGLHSKDIDINVEDYTGRNIYEQEFVSFFDFMNETLDKMSKDSNIEILRKTYNKSMQQFAQRLERNN